MATILLLCGCFVASSMYGEEEVLDVGFCGEHQHLFSPDKTLNEMAQDVYRIMREDEEG